VQLRVLSHIADVAAPEWDALRAGDANPFVRHAFLDALESSGCAVPRAGWRPRHLAVFRGARLVAAAPAYEKADSHGDFSRDWHLADAAERAGLAWYPKLVLGVPFTPATGPRLLVAPGERRAELVAALVEGALALARRDGLAGVQVLFPAADEARELEAHGLAARVDVQYHWVNAGYRTPDDFLARFPSKRRNALRRERAAPARQGIEIRTVRGDELRDGRELARAAYELHRRTVDRMDWGMRFVNRAFYERIVEAMPDAVEIVTARREGRLVAMAFNLASPERLWGRYWGCSEDHPFLHFNVCLYHSIDECIRRGVRAFEGGAGGEHKLWRGFEPTPTWSALKLLDPRLDAAIRRHVVAERAERDEALARFRAESPILREVG
jgi:predicted N-acyltransferase